MFSSVSWLHKAPQSYISSALRLFAKRAAFVVVLCPAAVFSGTAPVAGLDAMDSMVAREFAQDSVGSITAGVVAGADLVWTQSYGFADMGTRRKANRETVYRIGSITKMFTGVMLLQLVEAGTIRLSDPVQRFLPELANVEGLPTDAPPFTFLQVATMTSGLAAEPGEEGPFWSGPVSNWEATLISALPHSRYEFSPGVRFSYSNLGYAILGAALGRASGAPYVDWQRTRVLEPLGMQHTYFEVDPRFAGELATGYVVGENNEIDSVLPQKEALEGRGYKVPNGALFTTVGDMGRFVAFELGNGPDAVLPRARLDDAFKGLVAASADLDVGYGIGFMVQRRADFTWLGHSGGVPGYTAMVYFDREWQLGVIVLRSATGGKARVGRLAIDMLKHLIDAKIEAEQRRP